MARLELEAEEVVVRLGQLEAIARLSRSKWTIPLQSVDESRFRKDTFAQFLLMR